MHFINLNIVYDCGLQVFDHDLGTNGTFKLFLEGDKNIFEVRNEIIINKAAGIIVKKIINPLGHVWQLGDAGHGDQRGELHNQGSRPDQAGL